LEQGYSIPKRGKRKKHTRKKNNVNGTFTAIGTKSESLCVSFSTGRGRREEFGRRKVNWAEGELADKGELQSKGILVRV
jgi:hypothetical protein